MSAPTALHLSLILILPCMQPAIEISLAKSKAFCLTRCCKSCGNSCIIGEHFTTSQTICTTANQPQFKWKLGSCVWLAGAWRRGKSLERSQNKSVVFKVSFLSPSVQQHHTSNTQGTTEYVIGLIIYDRAWGRQTQPATASSTCLACYSLCCIWGVKACLVNKC